MSLQIQINGEPLDLFEGTAQEFYSTKQIHDLRDLTTRNADFTKQIDVPLTTNNIFLLSPGLGGLINTANQSPTEVLKASIIQEGITTVIEASLIVGQATKGKSVSINIFYGNYDFFSQIEGSIKEIDYDGLGGNEEDFQWNTTFIANDLSQRTTGIVYALADWFETSEISNVDPLDVTSNRQDILLSGFFIYTHYLIETIAEEVGFTIDRTAIDDAIYDQLALPAPFYPFVLQEGTGVIGVNDRNALGNLVFDSAILGTVNNLIVTFTSTPDKEDGITWLPGASEWRIVEPSVYTIIVRLRVDVVAGSNVSATVKLTQNGATLDSTTFLTNELNFQVSLNANLGLAINDLIAVRVDLVDGLGSNSIEITIEEFEAEFIIRSAGAEPDRDITGNEMREYLPDIPKREALTGVFNMLNIVCQTDPLTKIVYLEHFESILDNREQVFTHDVSRDTVRSTLLPNYFKENLFEYLEQDIPDLLRTDTDFIFEFDDARLQKQGTIISLPWGACDNSPRYPDSNRVIAIANQNAYSWNQSAGNGLATAVIGTDVVTFSEPNVVEVGDYIGFYNSRDIHRVLNVQSDTQVTVQGVWEFGHPGQSFYISVPELVEPVPRIARLIPQQDEYTIVDGDYTNPATVGITSGSFEAVFDTQMIWQTLIAENYTEMLNALKNPLIIQAWFVFTPIEFNQLDFLKPVYMPEESAYFYLNKVEQYVPNRPTRCELVRL